MHAPDTIIRPDNGVMRVTSTQASVHERTWRGLFEAVAFAHRVLDGCADLALERALRRAA